METEWPGTLPHRSDHTDALQNGRSASSFIVLEIRSFSKYQNYSKSLRRLRFNQIFLDLKNRFKVREI